MRPIAFAVLAALGSLATPVQAQDIMLDPEGNYVIQFDEQDGEPLEDFIDVAKVILGRPIKYSPEDVANTTIRIIGPITVEPRQFFKFFQAVLRAYDFIIMDYGPKGSSFLSIQRITSTAGPRAGGGFVKAQAPIVPVEELETYSEDPATLITTSIPLRYIDARGAMSTFNPFFDAQIEQVRNVENSNSLVITGFGTNVWGAYQLVGLVDVPPFQPSPEIRKRVLTHAAVDEVEPVLTELLAAARGLRPGQAAAPQQAGTLAIREIEPRIIIDLRSNALILAGEPEMVDRLASWIDILDVEVEPRSFTHVYRLQNTDSTSIEEVLNRVLEDERSAQTARAGAAGAAGGGTNSLEVPASVVADSMSNSLIITASDRRYAEIVETLRHLDVRRRQVLIELAIVETRKTINELFAAGFAVGDFDDGAIVSNFGTPTGFDAEAGMVDIAGTVANLGSGGTLAILDDDDIPIPLFLQWLETNTDNRVLSRPSLLTNDNEEAELASEQETAYQVTTTGANSITTSSFETVTAGIRLGVSPTISAGNYLRLLVRLEVSDFSDSRLGPTSGAPPDINIREIETPVTVPDGHTIILGGLVSRSVSKTASKVPWLGDLPLIGWLFRSTSDDNRDAYLYVFITAHIIDTDFALLDEISAARKQDVERLGGDVSELMSSLSVDPPPDSIAPLAGIEQVFDMPVVVVPRWGERPPDHPQDEESYEEAFGYEGEDN